jgi:large conductance mechanosensitive channel
LTRVSVEREVEKMKKTWQDFVAFIMTGNVLMLAVAFILGGATKAVVDSFVTNIVKPIIGAIVGKPTFTNSFNIGKGVITYGQFLTDVVNLVIIGAVLFLIVKGYDAYRARKVAAGEEPDEPTETVLLLRRIADAIAPQH